MEKYYAWLREPSYEELEEDLSNKGFELFYKNDQLHLEGDGLYATFKERSGIELRRKGVLSAHDKKAEKILKKRFPHSYPRSYFGIVGGIAGMGATFFINHLQGLEIWPPALIGGGLASFLYAGRKLTQKYIGRNIKKGIKAKKLAAGVKSFLEERKEDYEEWVKEKPDLIKEIKENELFENLSEEEIVEESYEKALESLDEDEHRKSFEGNPVWKIFAGIFGIKDIFKEAEQEQESYFEKFQKKLKFWDKNS